MVSILGGSERTIGQGSSFTLEAHHEEHIGDHIDHHGDEIQYNWECMAGSVRVTQVHDDPTSSGAVWTLTTAMLEDAGGADLAMATCTVHAALVDLSDGTVHSTAEAATHVTIVHGTPPLIA